MIQNTKPKEIIEQLDKYIISQDDLKKSLAIAIRDKYRYSKVSDKEEIKEDIIPHNILIKGSSGTGKTASIKRLAKIYNAPFIKTDATQYSQLGIVGRSIIEVVTDIVTVALNDLKKTLVNDPDIAKKANNWVLDILLGPTSSIQIKAQYENDLESGKLDNKLISFKENIMKADMQTGTVKQEIVSRELTVKEALKFIKERFINEALDTEEFKNKAKKNAEVNGIIFIDEIDKTIRSENDSFRGGPSESVQKELLTIVEGTTIQTKYGDVDTSNMLFIVGGAFSQSKVSDLTPEFQGRFPVRIEMSDISKEELYLILKNSKSSIINQVKVLFKVDNIDLEFTDDSLQELANYAYELNSSKENTGARRLNTIVDLLLKDLSLDAGNGDISGKVIIDQEYVKTHLPEIDETDLTDIL